MLETQSFLKVKEVAKRLNVGISTIYRLKDSGELPY
jgi:excisionase family DNA binding protein